MKWKSRSTDQSCWQYLLKDEAKEMGKECLYGALPGATLGALAASLDFLLSNKNNLSQIPLVAAIGGCYSAGLTLGVCALTLSVFNLIESRIYNQKKSTIRYALGLGVRIGIAYGAYKVLLKCVEPEVNFTSF